MQSVNYSSARNNLKKLMGDVCDNYEPVIITNKDGKNVVMIALDEYNSIQETLYLMSTQSNRQRLLNSIQEIENNKYQEKQLLEE